MNFGVPANLRGRACIRAAIVATGGENGLILRDMVAATQRRDCWIEDKFAGFPLFEQALPTCRCNFRTLVRMNFRSTPFRFVQKNERD